MVHGNYFDGHYATAHPVIVTLDASRVFVSGETIGRDEPLAAVVISERIGSTPRFIRFGDGASCEVTDIAAFDAMLSTAGMGTDRLSTWERSRGLVAVLCAFMLIGVVGGYQVVLPWLARTAADRLPAESLGSISMQVLSALDAAVFEPSALDDTRQWSLNSQFSRLKLRENPDLPMLLTFRRSPVLGPNAMALPSGVIIVTDELVGLALNDLELMAVLAHEAGHVQARHGMRNVIQSSVMSVLVTWYVGDISGLAAAAPTALLEARYSRDLEREADAFAADTLAINDIPVGFLVDILARLEARHGGPGAYTRATSYLSSHPATPERLNELRRYGQ